ncbi:21503_t:CDS:2 [Gigaspora margarita]|uniref:21503_t:CDS:1 n=1 Tax=Gigaspora margarita TaxID=4874 RepID=A0ABN7VEB1_GIGMA|nr:21503_t:CDS:2 [Gigaspora margarita]
MERTENIRKVEVKESEEHEQDQIDEDNSEEMYSWWRDLRPLSSLVFASDLINYNFIQ